MKLNDSTKRSLRTAYHLAVALVTLTPLLLTLLKGTPVEADLAIFAGWAVAVSKAINMLEDKGLIPAWLKG